jgi:hypothetical protein
MPSDDYNRGYEAAMTDLQAEMEKRLAQLEANARAYIRDAERRIAAAAGRYGIRFETRSDLSDH